MGAAAEAVLSWEPHGAAVRAVLVDRETGARYDLARAGSVSLSLSSSDALSTAGTARSDAANGLLPIPSLRPLIVSKSSAPRFWVVVEEIEEREEAALTLAPPAPNPARGTVRLRYDVPRASAVRLSIVDLLGREVAVLIDGSHSAGAYEARVEAGRFAPGVYVARLASGAEVRTQRFTVVR